MANDVVEGAVLRPDLVQAAGVERDIGEPGPGDPVAPRGDLNGRDVDAEKARPGPGGGKRNEVAARSAADLEHPRRRDVRRLDAGPERGRRHPRRLLARVGQRFIGRPVVARPGAGDGVADVGWRRRESARRRSSPPEPQARPAFEVDALGEVKSLRPPRREHTGNVGKQEAGDDGVAVGAAIATSEGASSRSGLARMLANTRS